MRPTTPAANAPAVSLILLTHDCERFVAAAFQSALAQDYAGPLEIIVSDDASTDRSFDTVGEHAARYRGPHRVALRRRPVNSGSKSAHLNDVFPLCSGEILVSCDGDDIAVPSRVTKIVERFAADGLVQAVFSALSPIDELGRPFGNAAVPHPRRGDDDALWFARIDAYAAGSTLAVRRTVVEAFGPLDPAVNEDIVLPFRASLLGRVEFVAEPLVRYRRYASSLTADWQRFSSLERYRRRQQAGIESAERARRSRLRDLEAADERMPEQHERWERLRERVEQSMREARMTRTLTDDSLGVRLRTLIRLTAAGAYRREWLQHACLALMPRIYFRYKRFCLGVEPPRRITNADIRGYWDRRVHDTELSPDPQGSAAFFAAMDAYRYGRLNYLPRLVDFPCWKDRDVLDLGCGAGLDLVRFARVGARVTGVELSYGSLSLARQYLTVTGLEATLLQADATGLPFPDKSFDLVFCHGVLPFAVDEAGIVAEIRRVLRRDGLAIVMVYNRRSWMSALRAVSAVRPGHGDAPVFRMHTRRELDAQLSVFSERIISAERLGWHLVARCRK